MTTSEQLIDLNGSAYIQSSSSTISATGFTSPTIYVNGQVSSTLTANRWQHVTVTTATGISASALKLGQISSNYGQLFMDEFQLYSTELSANQVQSLYNARGGNLTNLRMGDYDQKVLSDGLVGYWKMDDTRVDSEGEFISDSSGYNNGATLFGDNGSEDNGSGMDCTVSGKFGNSCNFDGTDDWMDVRDRDYYSANYTNMLTVSAWVNLDSNTTAYQLISKGAVNEYEWSLFTNSSGAFYSTIFNANGNTYLQAGTSDSFFSADTDYFLTMTVDTSEEILSIYVNGNLIAQDTTASGSYTNNGAALAFGRRIDETGPTDGSIDEVRIYNRTLSPAEVKQLYEWAPGPVGW